MPMENLEEQGLEKNPDLNLAQLKFKLTLSDFKNDAAIKDEIMLGIEKDSELIKFTNTCNINTSELISIGTSYRYGSCTCKCSLRDTARA